jgi:hypothetical protein
VGGPNVHIATDRAAPMPARSSGGRAGPASSR